MIKFNVEKTFILNDIKNKRKNLKKVFTTNNNYYIIINVRYLKGKWELTKTIINVFKEF
ncbi:hypothetical protein NX821_000743 [Clostridium septicum]|uniref:hypothetical protein n=1 Tax=Clostridium septicum TaxID=1504 RepID=UPI003217A105